MEKIENSVKNVKLLENSTLQKLAAIKLLKTLIAF